MGENLSIIICNNCGTTNNENLTRICRTCGALLPISTRSSRKKKQKDKKETKSVEVPAPQKPEEPTKKEKREEEKLELHEIPIEDNELDDFSNLEEIPLETIEDAEFNSLTVIPTEKEQDSEKEKKPILQEITPKPYQGTMLSKKREYSSLLPKSNDIISDAFSELKKSILEIETEKPKPSVAPLPKKEIDVDESLIKQRKLEKDMTEVLSFLSKKLPKNKIKAKKAETPSTKSLKDRLPPTSMNEILKELIDLDSRIEASAILKTDGTILASAISSRISESLFTTIGINLSMISSDIIDGLSAGSLKSISLKGTEGILDIAFLDIKYSSLKNMILILFSHPKVKSGIISIAVNLIKKRIKDYLGLDK